MSEMKHMSLPWKAIDTPITWQVRDAANEVVTESWGYSSLPDNNASLIVTSVNARPKVEELVERMLQFISEKDAFIMPTNAEWKQMLGKAREVEAALKVSP